MKKTTVFGKPAARILSRKKIFRRHHQLDLFDLAHASMQPGAPDLVIRREIMDIGDIVSVLPYDPEKDMVVLNRQFRTGAFLAGDADPFMFECAAGKMDRGETLRAAALREALEETGCKIRALEPMGFYHTSSGSLRENVRMFVGRISGAVPGFYGVAAEGEEIQTRVVPVRELAEMADSNLIRDARSAVAVNWFLRHRARIRKKWLGGKKARKK